MWLLALSSLLPGHTPGPRWALPTSIKPFENPPPEPVLCGHDGLDSPGVDRESTGTPTIGTCGLGRTRIVTTDATVSHVTLDLANQGTSFLQPAIGFGLET